MSKPPQKFLVQSRERSTATLQIIAPTSCDVLSWQINERRSIRDVLRREARGDFRKLLANFIPKFVDSRDSFMQRCREEIKTMAFNITAKAIEDELEREFNQFYKSDSKLIGSVLKSAKIAGYTSTLIDLGLHTNESLLRHTDDEMIQRLDLTYSKNNGHDTDSYLTLRSMWQFYRDQLLVDPHVLDISSSESSDEMQLITQKPKKSSPAKPPPRNTSEQITSGNLFTTLRVSEPQNEEKVKLNPARKRKRTGSAADETQPLKSQTQPGSVTAIGGHKHVSLDTQATTILDLDPQSGKIYRNLLKQKEAVISKANNTLFYLPENLTSTLPPDDPRSSKPPPNQTPLNQKFIPPNASTGNQPLRAHSFKPSTISTSTFSRTAKSKVSIAEAVSLITVSADRPGPTVYDCFRTCFDENTPQGVPGKVCSLVNIRFGVTARQEPQYPRGKSTGQRYQKLFIVDSNGLKTTIFVWGNETISKLDNVMLSRANEKCLFEIHKISFKSDRLGGYEFIINPSMVSAATVKRVPISSAHLGRARTSLDKLRVPTCYDSSTLKVTTYNDNYSRFLCEIEKFKHAHDARSIVKLDFPVMVTVKEVDTHPKWIIYKGCKHCKLKFHDSVQRCERCKSFRKNPEHQYFWKARFHIAGFHYRDRVVFDVFDYCMKRLMQMSAADFADIPADDRARLIQKALHQRPVIMRNIRLKWYNDNIEVGAYYYLLKEPDFECLADEVYRQLVS